MSTFIEWELYRQISRHHAHSLRGYCHRRQRRGAARQRKDAPALGQWWLPGGRVLKGEMMKDAAIRKAREEVGIECHVASIIHTAETIFPDGPDGIPVHSINSCFFLYPTSAEFQVRLDLHQSDYQWVDHIPAGLHEYVERCLLGAGLTRRVSGA